MREAHQNCCALWFLCQGPCVLVFAVHKNMGSRNMASTYLYWQYLESFDEIDGYWRQSPEATHVLVYFRHNPRLRSGEIILIASGA
jgi:hypothetical protein